MKCKKHFAVALLLVAAAVAAIANSEITKVEAVGIENYSLFDGSPGFAGSPVGFGGATQPAAMEWLKDEGFVTVISLRLVTEEVAGREGNRAAAEAAGLNYIHLPFDPETPDEHVIQSFMAAVGDKENQPVYIHCNSATRAAALWIVGRVLEDGLDIDQAGEEGKAIAKKPEKAMAFASAYIASQEQ